MRTKLLTALFLVGIAAPARADVNLALGMKWVPVNYTRPVSASSGAMTQDLLGGWQHTSLDNYFGVFFLRGMLGFQLSLDVGYGTLHTDTTATGMTVTTDNSFTQFGFALGGKFHLTPPKRERVSPYVYVDFYKYFASVSTSDKGVPNDQAGFVAGLVSPLGFNVALGAEYFFTPAFSIGAEVLGIRFAYTEGDYTTGAGGFGSDIKHSENHKALTFYTAISLNYRFAVSGTVSVRQVDEEGDSTTPRRPRRQRVDEQTEPPPQSPESVD
jgi:hypothetical protein